MIFEIKLPDLIGQANQECTLLVSATPRSPGGGNYGTFQDIQAVSLCLGDPQAKAIMNRLYINDLTIIYDGVQQSLQVMRKSLTSESSQKFRDDLRLVARFLSEVLKGRHAFAENHL